MPRFMISLIGDEAVVAEATPELMEKIVADMDEYNAELEEAGVVLTGDGLGPSANSRTLRYGEDGKAVVTDFGSTALRNRFYERVFAAL